MHDGRRGKEAERSELPIVRRRGTAGSGRLLGLRTVWSHHPFRACLVGRVDDMTADQPPTPAAEPSEPSGITTTDCRGCGSQVSGISGRYACGVCGWTNPWDEGHQELPVADDDPDWPRHGHNPST
ncbi:hypothetical protein GCM10010277_08630 [Streptomyces longisporoflavus]|nr:hypothetical protein GCM10010277_08630 [Streptomyces longisporoflavus]